MKIFFERTGGIMGRSVSTTVDTNQLPPEEALKLLEMVQETDFFTLRETASEPPLMRVPDEMEYCVTVEVAGVQHTVRTSDTQAPRQLQPLLHELSQIARQPPDETGAAH